MAYQAPDLGPSKRVPRLKNPASQRPKVRKPSELAAERQRMKEERKPLSESLTEAASAMPPGEGVVGKALKAGTSGAAAGATLGEALARMHQQKIQRGERAKARTLSENAIGGDNERKRKSR